MKTHYATAAEFLADFERMMASRAVSVETKPPARPAPSLQRKTLDAGTLRHTPPAPIRRPR